MESVIVQRFRMDILNYDADMSEAEADHRRRNIQQQQELYGAPLASVVFSLTSTLGLSQADLARVLGLSAPMLSHLVGGRRVKIGNPVVGARLTQLRQLVADVDAGHVPPDGVPARVQAIARSSEAWSGQTEEGTGELPTGRGPSAAPLARPADQHTTSATVIRREPTDGVRVVQDLFRASAAAGDWLAAADRLSEEFPEIAEVLRVYGAGRTDAAAAHWQRTLS